MSSGNRRRQVRDTKIAIVGGGHIGSGWAIAFARAGFRVAVHEPHAGRRAALDSEMTLRLAELGDHGLLGEDPAEVVSRVRIGADLDQVVKGAAHVQECVPESLDLKVRLFRRLDTLAESAATLATSSSSMTISEIASDLEGRSRCLLVHPGNPPYLIKVVEVAPAPFTRPEAVESVREILSSAGMVPVTIHREIDCLVFNRLQGALLREALCLVRDGIISPEDLELVVTEGLGLRWSVIGPFTTVDLNTRGGIRAHAEGVGSAYSRIMVRRGADDPWESDVVDRVAESLEARRPVKSREEHVLLRDGALMGLAADRLRRAR